MSDNTSGIKASKRRQMEARRRRLRRRKRKTRHAARGHVMYSLSDSIWHNIWHQSSVA